MIIKSKELQLTINDYQKNLKILKLLLLVILILKIQMIDQGKVESVGNHAKLLQTSTIYKKLYENAQLAENFQY